MALFFQQLGADLEVFFGYAESFFESIYFFFSYLLHSVPVVMRLDAFTPHIIGVCIGMTVSVAVIKIIVGR